MRGQRPVSTVVTPTEIRGDLDMDGKITIADLVLMKHGILNGFRNNAEKRNADVDQSTVTDAADAVNLQKYLLGMTMDSKGLDFDGNGKINITDLIKAKSHILEG